MLRTRTPLCLLQRLKTACCTHIASFGLLFSAGLQVNMQNMNPVAGLLLSLLPWVTPGGQMRLPDAVVREAQQRMQQQQQQGKRILEGIKHPGEGIRGVIFSIVKRVRANSCGVA